MIYSLLSLNRSFLLVMKSKIIFRNFSYIWLRFLSLSVYYRCLVVREQIWSADDLFSWISFNQIRVVSQSEQSRSSQALEFLQNRFAVKAIFDFCKSSYSCKIASQSKHFISLIKSLNLYNDVRFWITRKTIRRRTTNHNHKQKERRSEERISDAKNNNLKKI